MKSKDGISEAEAVKVQNELRKIEFEGKKIKDADDFRDMATEIIDVSTNRYVDTVAGLAYRINKETNSIEMSMRGSYNSKYNLGKIIPKIAKELNGSGGGHSKAVGLRIPIKNKNKFLKSLKTELEKR